MAEELNVTLFEKKNEWDNKVKHDFALPQELTVTITLNEYRELIYNNATATSEKFAKLTEINDLKHEIAQLVKEKGEIAKENEMLRSMLQGKEVSEA